MYFSLWVELSYLLSSVLFVFGLKKLQSPDTARTGNRLAALAMLIAIVATLIDNEIFNVHGGLSPSFNDINELKLIDRK